jgi:hypothetical protein
MRYEGRKLVGAALVWFMGESLMPEKSRSIEDYTLRVEIIEVDWSQNAWGMSGIGHGNVFNPSGEPNGFEFTSTCAERFTATVGNQAYPARWKKERASLALRGTRIGDERKHDECEHKVSLSDFLYANRGGHLVTVPREQLRAAIQKKQEAATPPAPVDSDPAHYPLQFVLLQVNWTPANPGFDGLGRGDLMYQDKSVKGAEFTSHCSSRLFENVKGQWYQARLNESSDKLLLLGHVIGQQGENSYRVCELKVDLKPFVFIKTPDGVAPMTQDEYQKRAANKPKEQTASASLPAEPK